MEYVVSILKAEREAYSWATRGGAELDLLVVRGGKRYGFEFKFADAPGTSRSMRVALTDLNLERLFIVFPGERSFPLDEKFEAVPLVQLAQRLAGL